MKSIRLLIEVFDDRSHRTEIHKDFTDLPDPMKLTAIVLTASLCLLLGCQTSPQQPAATPTPSPAQTRLVPKAVSATPPLPSALALRAPDAVTLAAPVAPALKAVTLAWDPVSGVAGYKLFQGVAPGDYTNSVNAGTNTTATVQVDRQATNYFAAVSVSSGGLQSAYSAEVVLAPPAATNPPTVLYFSALIQTNSTLNTNAWATMATLPMVTMTNPPPLQFYRVLLRMNAGAPP